MVTHTPTGAADPNGRPSRGPSEKVREHYRSLLHQLPWPANGDSHPLRTLGITSCCHGEGVSTVASEIAAAAASTGRDRVLLVDANLAGPSLEHTFKLNAGDVLAFTSLRDTSGNVVLEALSRGLPVICLDHQGVRDMVTDDCGIKIPVDNPRQAVADFRASIVGLRDDPAKLERLRHGALARARQYLWSRQGERAANLYRRFLEGASGTEIEEGLLDGERHVGQVSATIGNCARDDSSDPGKQTSLGHAETARGDA